MLDPLAPRDPGADIEFLLAPVRVVGDHDVDLLADGLIRGVAVQRGRRIVPGQDLPVQILGLDRVVGVLHDRRQVLRRLEHPPLGDVPGEPGRGHDPAGGVAHRGDRH